MLRKLEQLARLDAADRAAILALPHRLRNIEASKYVVRQLADLLGLTPVHVNRTLKTLEIGGLIARDKRSVTIAD